MILGKEPKFQVNRTILGYISGCHLWDEKRDLSKKDPEEILQWIHFLDAKPVHLPYHNLSGNFFNFFGIQTRWCDQYHFLGTHTTKYQPEPPSTDINACHLNPTFPKQKTRFCFSHVAGFGPTVNCCLQHTIHILDAIVPAVNLAYLGTLYVHPVTRPIFCNILGINWQCQMKPRLMQTVFSHSFLLLCYLLHWCFPPRAR